MENKLEQFLKAILETRKVWLLEAKEGFFAMLEDNDGVSYVPLWESEELAADEIDIAVSPEKDGQITAIPSYKFGKWLKPYDDHSYKEQDDEEDEDFDYGDGWAQPWQ